MSSAAAPGKTPRILACVLCQHRKIKCDRNTPCSNCVKANVTCTPSIPAPARKRRRPNQDLQQRLARCEELLQEYATTKPNPDGTGDSPNVEDGFKSAGKLIQDEGSVRFMESFLWANVHDELRAMREIIDDDEKDDESTSTPADGLTPDHNAGLLFSDGCSDNLDDLHPEPAQIFRLWQTFVDRVNPVAKVLHIPTVQPMLVEAATDRSAIPKPVEALMFAVYTIAALSLTEVESLAMLGCSKDEAFKRFSKGVRIALMRVGVLHKSNLLVLQAMVLYLTSLTGRYDRHAAWILNGVVVRIAQKMGLHKDGTALGLSAFESEIRRRIWWQIVLLDCTFAFMSGLNHSLFLRDWTTKKPTNINDADLFPTMKVVEEREGPTDMVFVFVSCEIAQLLCEGSVLEQVILENEQGLPGVPSKEAVEGATKRIDKLDETLREILEKYCDLSMGPVHEFAMRTRTLLVGKMHELIRPMRDQPEWGTEILVPKDNLFKLAITDGEHSLAISEMASKQGPFTWLVMTHFQPEVFFYMIGQLCYRTSGALVERAWVVADKMYTAHTELFDLTFKPHASLAVFVLRAWKKREETLKIAKGFPPQKPYYVAHLESLLGPAADESFKSDDQEPLDMTSFNAVLAATDKAGAAGPNNAADVQWDQMLGSFGDPSSVDWNMFGGANEMNAAPLSTYPGYSMGGHWL